MHPFPALLHRDPNTGAENLLAFAEWLAQATTPSTLIDIQFQQPLVPTTSRWMVIILREELGGTVYQLGTTQLVVSVRPIIQQLDRSTLNVCANCWNARRNDSI